MSAAVASAPHRCRGGWCADTRIFLLRSRAPARVLRRPPSHRRATTPSACRASGSGAAAMLTRARRARVRCVARARTTSCPRQCGRAMPTRRLRSSRSGEGDWRASTACTGGWARGRAPSVSCRARIGRHDLASARKRRRMPRCAALVLTRLPPLKLRAPLLARARRLVLLPPRVP